MQFAERNGFIVATITFNNAKKNKADEFYTQLIDIEKEVEAYLEFNP